MTVSCWDDTCAVLVAGAGDALASYHGAAPADAGFFGWLAWEVEHLFIHAGLALSAVWEGLAVGSPWLALHLLGMYAEVCARDSLVAGFLFGSAGASLVTLALPIVGMISLVGWLIGRQRLRLTYA